MRPIAFVRGSRSLGVAKASATPQLRGNPISTVRHPRTRGALLLNEQPATVFPCRLQGREGVTTQTAGRGGCIQACWPYQTGVNTLVPFFGHSRDIASPVCTSWHLAPQELRLASLARKKKQRQMDSTKPQLKTLTLRLRFVPCPSKAFLDVVKFVLAGPLRECTRFVRRGHASRVFLEGTGATFLHLTVDRSQPVGILNAR